MNAHADVSVIPSEDIFAAPLGFHPLRHSVGGVVAHVVQDVFSPAVRGEFSFGALPPPRSIIAMVIVITRGR